MPSDCNGLSCFQQIFEKKLRIYLWNLGLFTFLWVVAPSWQDLCCRFFVSAEPNRTILSIHRSEPRSKVIQGVK